MALFVHRDVVPGKGFEKPCSISEANMTLQASLLTKSIRRIWPSMRANSPHLAGSLRGKFLNTPTSCLRQLTNCPATGLYVHHKEFPSWEVH